MPQAEIIADRFHLQKAINCELDAYRKALKRKALTHSKKSEKILQVLNKSKYILLTSVRVKGIDVKPTPFEERVF